MTRKEPSNESILIRLTVIAVLGAIGFAFAAVLSKHFYDIRSGVAAFKSFCNVSASFNCDTVTASRYAELLPGLPLAAFSAAWFACIVIFTFVARNVFWRREALRALFLMGIGGVIFSGIYYTIMAWILRSFCLMCLGVDVVNVILFALVLTLRPEWIRPHRIDAAKWKFFVPAGLAAAVIIVGGLKLALDKREPVNYDQEVTQILATPVVAVNSGTEFPSIGPKHAPVTIVEFTDFQCPFCQRGALILNSLLNMYPTKVRLVYRSFPLDPSCNRTVEHAGHAAACEAARIVACAAATNGPFQAVYEQIFDNQQHLAPGKVMDLVKEADLGSSAIAEIEKCVTSETAASKIMRDVEEGAVLGIRSTPTFFINGHRVDGAYPLDIWQKLVLALAP